MSTPPHISASVDPRVFYHPELASRPILSKPIYLSSHLGGPQSGYIAKNILLFDYPSTLPMTRVTTLFLGKPPSS